MKPVRQLRAAISAARRACQSRATPTSNRLMATTIRLILLSTFITTAATDELGSHKLLISAEKTDHTYSPSPTYAILINNADNNNKAKPHNELPSGDLAEFVDNNYLSSSSNDSPLGTTSQTRTNSPTTTTSKHLIQEEISTLSSSSSSSNTHKQSSTPTPTGKTRRQVGDNKTKMADWWNELLKKNNVKRSGSTKGRPGGLESILRRSSKPSIYKEQPLSQNPILTFRNQLIAIRDKHRLLMNKAVPQLQQLDQRLIDSYRLCMKRKMPLYGGMLYRTRDFVVRMANEVKHQRQVLEAMAKQIQKRLRDGIANKTLIKEYNQAVQTAESEGELKLQQLVSVPIDEMDSKRQLDNLKVITVSPAFDVQAGNDADGLAKTTAEPTSERSAKDKKGNILQTKSTHEQQREEDGDDCSTKHETKPRQATYTVNINEVNLKKELAKTQALVNRINGSYYELNGVIDDILYLFKLTSEPKRTFGKTHNKHDMTHGNSYFSSSWMSSSSPSDPMMTPAEQQRKLRKMLKSPLRIYLERYGKLTMGNFENMYIPANLTDNKNMKLVNGTATSEMIMSNNLDNMNVTELKPLFDAASLSGSLELSDQDLGFEGSTLVSTSVI